MKGKPVAALLNTPIALFTLDPAEACGVQSAEAAAKSDCREEPQTGGLPLCLLTQEALLKNSSTCGMWPSLNHASILQKTLPHGSQHTKSACQKYCLHFGHNLLPL